MKPKWRYNARLAVKKGVKVTQYEIDKFDAFYELLKETATRDGILIHSYTYYRTLLECNWYSGLKPDFRLYLAEHDGDLLSGIITMFWKKQAVYLYGASSGFKRSLMAPYALQLKAMEDAISSGCETYDLYGIPPNADPAHSMAGLFLFKTGFGGKIIHRMGCWDYRLMPFRYNLFSKVEKIRSYNRNTRKNIKKSK